MQVAISHASQCGTGSEGTGLMSAQAYCLAKTFKQGVAGSFCDGPHPEFDPDWLDGEELVFVASESAAPRLALSEIAAHADRMSLAFTEMFTIELMDAHKDLPAPDSYLVNAILAKASWHFDFDRDGWGRKTASTHAYQIAKFPMPDQTVSAPPAPPVVRDQRSRAERYRC